MTAEILIVVPVLARPKNALPLAESVARATRTPYRLVYMCSPNDPAEEQSARQTGHEVIVVPWLPHRGDYARKINHAFSRGDEPWLFQASDDLCFHEGWDLEALKRGERDGAGVVGTNDLGNPRVTSGMTSTHSLIRRAYVESEGGAWREPGFVMHQGYYHNFCDEELVDVAKVRNVFTFAGKALVEHMHPHWKKAQLDATYNLGLKRFSDDQRLYARRRRLWRAL